ncbi:hypothetical protein TESG_08268 [Trichophyton tonsurans CBS 112818]|uniref:Uncharacterized protein n=2 Tax=Trichophyton TaxID=5550 RepID=F2PN56_TRIEC|nr:hypothetical protein TESG_08268 [Trichophyton tonsurans CBS 112818]EGE03324.1 hypothetical protein TEQG_08628 [Trichophyton equinum CBS 127.97]
MPVPWASLMQTKTGLIKLSTAGNRQEVPVPCIAYDAMDTCQQPQQVESSCKIFVVSGSRRRMSSKDAEMGKPVT